MEALLLRAQLQGRSGLLPADVERVLHWSNYAAKSVALIQENRAAVIGELLRQFDPSYGTDDPIYTPDGEWSYARFERWLLATGVTAWPRLDSGRLDTDSDAFRLMYHVRGIERLHALRDSLGTIVRAKLPIGHDGRNRPSLFPFGTATGRNAHAKSLYNAHAGMRSLMIFPAGTIGVYLDWRTQEVGIAAALSDDQALMNAYRSGDVYHDLARICGCFGRFSHRWQRWHIDARDVGISDKQQIKEWAEDHEEDPYFFMMRVRGQFPTAGALQFIDTDLVEQAMVREPQSLPNDPLVVGVDVARFGDDCSVIYARRGMDARSILPIIVRKTGTDRVEDMILQFCTEHQPDVIFVDGSGAGGAVVDHLANRHNLPVEDIQFGSKALNATNQVRYAQRRSEMWGNMRDALKYLATPNSSELRDQLIGPEYDYNLRGELQLEKKSDMKQRGLASPDIADALALTFARPVFPRQYDDWPAGRGYVVSDYDPVQEFEREQSARPRTPPRYYAPGYPRLRDDYE